MTNVLKNFWEELEIKKFKEFIIIIFVALSIGLILTLIKRFLNLDEKTTNLVDLTILIDKYIVSTSIFVLFVKWFIIFYLKQVEEVCIHIERITNKEPKNIRIVGIAFLIVFLIILFFIYIKYSLK